MLENKEAVQKYVGGWCREFRMEELAMTLHQVVGMDSVKALSAFEMGRSSNMLFLLEYIVLAIEEDKQDSLNELFEGVEKIKKGGGIDE